MNCDSLRIENACVYGPDAKVLSSGTSRRRHRRTQGELNEKDKDIAYWREEYDKETQLTDALKDEIESLKASHYAEMVDAGMRERRLKRALYKACVMWAKCEERISRMDAYDASEYLPSAEKQFRKKAERWGEMESKCRAKAEEYK